MKPLLEELREARKKNIAIMAQMAELLPPEEALGFEALGFRLRDPDGPDVTFEVIKAALEAAPERAQALLRLMVTNDLGVVAVAILLAKGER